ncbi:MAG TPA: flavodoxin domain-containing protein [Burkholderiales bacterium]
MKTLVVVYSRTGWTHRAGEEIARECGAELRVIEDVNSRRGLFGYWRSIQDARKARQPAIKPMSLDLRPYDLVILGAPVWAGHMAAPMRSFIRRHKEELRRVAVFCTMRGSGADRALEEMAQALGRAPIARLALKDSEIKKGASAQIRDFLGIAGALAAAGAEPVAPREEAVPSMPRSTSSSGLDGQAERHPPGPR